jgi:hypothetical protein
MRAYFPPYCSLGVILPVNSFTRFGHRELTANNGFEAPRKNGISDTTVSSAGGFEKNL